MQETILLPDQDAASMDNIARGVAGLRIAIVNVFGIAAEDGSWTLVDAGLYFSADRIRSWAETHFGAPPTSILLTHGHSDHVGSLRPLAETWDVPIYAHPLELPYLTGKSKYPPPDPAVGGGAMAWMARIYPRGPIDIRGRVRPLPADGSVPNLPGWRWIHTPGHTAGHVSFFRDDDRVLIAGDAFVTTKQESLSAAITQRPELHGPPAYYTSDWDAAGLSVGRLAALMPNVAACGHGRPMSGPDFQDALIRLAEDFDRVARPWKGRYAHAPAIADERGVISVPPAVGSPVPKLLIGAAVAGAVVYAIAKRR